MHACIDTDRVPAWNLIEWIDILLNSFQIADDADSRSSLRYYQQREWRVVQMYSPLIDCHPISPFSELTESQFFDNKQRLEVIKSLKEHSAAQGFRLDLENTFILSGTNGRHFRSFIRQIVAPVRNAGQVEDMLNERGHTQEVFSAAGGEQYAVFYLTE
jgi:hypothetical protein